MNPYVLETTCTVCGGPGCAMPRDAAAEWLGGGLRHRDPAVCAMFLEQKELELRRREKEQEKMEDQPDPIKETLDFLDQRT